MLSARLAMQHSQCNNPQCSRLGSQCNTHNATTHNALGSARNRNARLTHNATLSARLAIAMQDSHTMQRSRLGSQCNSRFSRLGSQCNTEHSMRSNDHIQSNSKTHPYRILMDTAHASILSINQSFLRSIILLNSSDLAMWTEPPELHKLDDYEISEDPTVQVNSNTNIFAARLNNLSVLSEEDIIIIPKIMETPITDLEDNNSVVELITNIRHNEKAHKSSVPRKFVFSPEDIDHHCRRLSEKKYKVSDFQEHLNLHLGRRRRSTGTAKLGIHQTALETTNKSARFAESSRKHSLNAPSFGALAIRKLSLKNVTSPSFDGNSLPTLTSSSSASLASSSSSSSLSSSGSNSRKSSFVSPSFFHDSKSNRKLSSRCILEKRILSGIPISPELTLPAIDIPSPNEALGKVVLKSSNPIKLAVQRAFFLD